MSRYQFAKYIPAAWLIILATLGGASRYDEWQQLIVPAVSLFFLVLACWTPDWADIRAKRMLWLLLAAVAAAIAIQLIPLPPSVWTRLPGREAFTRGAELAGVNNIWRPISLTPDLTWGGLFALLPIATTLAVAPRADSAAFRPLIWAMTAIFILGMLLGVAQTLGTGGVAFYLLHDDGTAVGLFANRNHHAIFLTLMFPVIAYLMATERAGSRQPWLALMLGAALGALCFVSIVQAGSRAGLVLGALMLGCVLIGMSLNYIPVVLPTRRFRGNGRAFTHGGWRTVSIASATIAAVIAVTVIVVRSMAFDRLVQTSVTYDFRAQIAPLLGQMAVTFFPFGSGYGSFATVFRQIEPFDLLRLTYLNQAHNDVAQVVIEGGLLGAGLIVAAVIGWLRQTVWLVRASPSIGRMAGIVGSLIVGALSLGSLADYPLRTPLLSGMMVFGAVLMTRGPASQA